MARSLGTLVIHLGLDDKGLQKGAVQARDAVTKLNSQVTQLRTVDLQPLTRSTGQFKESLSNTIPLLRQIDAGLADLVQQAANLSGAVKGVGAAGIGLGVVLAGVVALGKAWWDTIGAVQKMREEQAKQAAEAAAQAKKQVADLLANAKKAAEAAEAAAPQGKNMGLREGSWMVLTDKQRQEQLAYHERIRNAIARTVEANRKKALQEFENLRQVAEYRKELEEKSHAKEVKNVREVKKHLDEINALRQGVGAADRFTMQGFSAVQSGIRESQAREREAQHAAKQRDETNRILNAVLKKTGDGITIKEVNI